jgi:hypothetical protein
MYWQRVLWKDEKLTKEKVQGVCEEGVCLAEKQAR